MKKSVSKKNRWRLFHQDIPWDSSRAALHLLVGLFLTVGIWQFVLHGSKEIFFLLRAGSTPITYSKDLRQEPLSHLPLGYIRITGYPVLQKNSVYLDAQAPGFSFSESSVVFLSSTVNNQNTSSFIKVKIKEVSTPAAPDELPKFAPDSPITLTGLHGLDGNNIINEGARWPSWQRLMIWFIPSLASFLFGIYLIINWGKRLKRQFFF